MWQNTIPERAGPRLTVAWSLELELELCAAGRCEATDARLRSLTARLNDAEGVSLAQVEAHPRANLVRVSLTVEAPDPYAAHERACGLVRDRARGAGLGPAVLVAARAARRPAAGRRMG